MPEKQKIPLKKAVLVGIIYVPIVVLFLTIGDIFLLKNEFSKSKLIINIAVFSIVYIIFHKKMLKSE